METIPCPDFFSRSNFFKVMGNFPKFLFPSFICFNLVIQILYLCFISNAKDEWAGLMVLSLQLWIYISVFRSRTRILLLTEDLYRISNMLHAYTVQKKKMLKIYIWMNCLFVILGTAFFEVTFFRSGMIAYEQQELLNSEIIPAHLREQFADFLYVSFPFTLLLANGFFALLPGYYYFVCCCMKQFFLRFEMKSKVLIARHDYQRILEIYKKINETMIITDKFLSLPILVSVMNILATLFWYGYSFAFVPNDNKMIGLFFSMGFIQYFVLLMMTLHPAAASNQAAATATEIVMSLPGWFPKMYSIIKLLVCRSFMPKTALTLWNIYRIDKSFLISAIGTLITYGILLGTLGSVQSSNNKN
ncbi:uncharacterized protein CDAR_501931 [Caerostris darwini]|uniref:Odorant receptor n=1 Tax=Caerostris darwini TaxID=1538125 RepID=A0AAV4TQE6_9ARAC|nr:uncharacterized protein CDAR_501931 [Caerostris darwini]